MADVVAHIEPSDDLADEPCQRGIEDARTFRSDMPVALPEFVDGIAGLAAEVGATVANGAVICEIKSA